ncbi:hypothetical protein [Pseudodesulfovibrio sp.]|uniref:hypothetical protein n=1 Tax=Pseudodesulfovibrio sp. TaxID=2035812 RepID=UPI0026045589|nr:hypothetical protein [Pseudodesulfovibrio sp.]MDD3310940.1 hypothetical protein [Pseudodesulfovibrio sp.]
MTVFRRAVRGGETCPYRGLVVDYESAVLPVTLTAAYGWLDVDVVNHLWLAQAVIGAAYYPWIWGSYNPATCELTVAGTKPAPGYGDSYIHLLPGQQSFMTFFNSGGSLAHYYGTYDAAGEPTYVGSLSAIYGNASHGGIIDTVHGLWWAGTDSGGNASLQYGHITGGVPVSDGTYASGTGASQYIPCGVDPDNMLLFVYSSVAPLTRVLSYDATGAITGEVATLADCVQRCGVDGWAWSTNQILAAAYYPAHLTGQVVDYQGATVMPWPVLAVDHDAQIAFGFDLASNSICAGFYCN